MPRFHFTRKRLFALTALVFAVLIVFVDKNNLMDSWALRNKIRGLEEQRNYYLQKIVEDSTVLENLKDDEFLERVARENYYMKREGEVIYIVK